MTRSSRVPCPAMEATFPPRTTKKSQFLSPSRNRISPESVARRWPWLASAAIWASLSRGYAPCRSGVSAISPQGSDVGFVDIAPAPGLARLERRHDWVPDCEGVPARVPQRRGIAAAYVPAGQAQPQVHPRGPESQALLAALRRPRCHRADQAQVRIGRYRHARRPLVLRISPCLPGAADGTSSN